MSVASTNDKVNEASSDASDNGYIIGQVTSIDDPLQLNRIQVKIPNLYDPDLGPVPWCGPHVQSLFGVGVNWGVYGSPAVGSLVKIKLQGGDAHYPLYEASLYNQPNPLFSDPTSYGFQDPKGNIQLVSLTAGTWLFQTFDKSSYLYDGKGNLIEGVAAQYSMTAVDWAVSGSNTATLHSGANTTVASNGVLNISASGPINVGAGGVVTIQGSRILLGAGGAGSMGTAPTAPTLVNPTAAATATILGQL